MNKKNKILVACLALLLVLSVGYALFSETITINGTATAKGSFQITSNCNAGVSNELEMTMEELDAFLENQVSLVDVGYKNDICTVNGTKVSFSTDLLYPGAARRFTVEFKNTGTIPAQLNSKEIDFFYNSTRKVCKVDENGVVSTDCEEGLFWEKSDGTKDFSTMSFGTFVAAKDVNGNICKASEECMMNDYASYISDDSIILSLQPGETFYFLFEVYLPSDYQSATNSVSYKLEITKEILFEQVTN